MRRLRNLARRNLARLAQSGWGYVLAFALGVLTNRYLGTEKPLLPTWVAWLVPVVVFLGTWVWHFTTRRKP